MPSTVFRTFVSAESMLTAAAMLAPPAATIGTVRPRVSAPPIEDALRATGDSLLPSSSTFAPALPRPELAAAVCTVNRRQDSLSPSSLPCVLAMSRCRASQASLDIFSRPSWLSAALRTLRRSSVLSTCLA